jgi:hypothetical protein
MRKRYAEVPAFYYGLRLHPLIKRPIIEATGYAYKFNVTHATDKEAGACFFFHMTYVYFLFMPHAKNTYECCCTEIKFTSSCSYCISTTIYRRIITNMSHSS